MSEDSINPVILKRNSKARRITLKMIRIIIFSFIGFNLLYTAIIFFYQRRMIYYPKKYPKNYNILLPKKALTLQFMTNDGAQTCFYLPPDNNPDKPPDKLWVLFNGNASLALDWLDYFSDFHDARIGMLLIEYPGYGVCEGSPSLNGISANSEEALIALANRLNAKTDDLERDMNVLGFSLGTAAGLQFAAKHNVRLIILAAPFTSMLDMARLSVGKLLSHLLVDRYDNRTRINELIARKNPPHIFIFHGDKDNVVPFVMGKELAELSADKITFKAIHDADHATVFDIVKKDVIDIMMR